MREFALTIAGITAGMSALILLMLALLKLVGGKFTSRCRYILWTLVILRLAVPFGFSAPALIEVPIETEAQVPARDTVQSPVQYGSDYTPAAPDVPYTATAPSAESGSAIPIHTGEPLQLKEQVQIPVKPTENPAPAADAADVTYPANPTDPTDMAEPEQNQPVTLQTVEEYLPYLYISGVAAFLLWNFLSYLIYTAKITGSAAEADEPTLSVYRTVCQNCGIKHIPRLLVSSEVNSPIAFGLVRRKIVLPDIPLSESGLAGALSHELTHCRRGDLWVKVLSLLARAFHWFNPLVHIAAVRCECEMELSCDEAVLAGCDEDMRAEYGEVMLDIIRRCRRNQGALTTHFNPRKRAVKARFLNIMYGSGKRRGLWLIAVCVVLCIVSGAVVACRTVEAEDLAEAEAENDETAPVDSKAEPEVTEELLTSLMFKITEISSSPVLRCFAMGDDILGFDRGNPISIDDRVYNKITDSFFE